MNKSNIENQGGKKRERKKKKIHKQGFFSCKVEGTDYLASRSVFFIFPPKKKILVKEGPEREREREAHQQEDTSKSTMAL